MNAVIYTRISADKEAGTDDEGLGVARQEAECRALVSRLGYDSPDVFSDNSISAYTGKRRPGFERMLSAIQQGRYEVLVAWHTDRLFRNMTDLERLIQVCDESGTLIKTVNSGEMDLSNATGKMLARIIGSVARQESELKRERQIAAFRQKAEMGGWWSSLRPFGYTDDGLVDRREAKLLRQAVVDVLNGVSCTAVARRWNQAGVTTTFGKRWDVSRVKRTLMNPRYAGLRAYRDGDVSRGGFTVAGSWTALISEDDHNAICAVLSDKSRGAAVSYERKFIGSYRYLCGHVDGGVECGAPLRRTIARHKDGKTWSKYACSMFGHLARTQQELDALVESVAVERMRNEPRLGAALAATAGDGVDPQVLRGQRQGLRAKVDQLATLLAEGVLDVDGVRRESLKLQRQIEAIDGVLADLSMRSPLSGLLADGLDGLDEKWAALSPDLKGKVLDELFTVVVHPAPRGRYFRPEFIEFRWK